MNENPYASPRAYEERRPVDWDRVFRVWFNVGLACGKCGVLVMVFAWALRGWGIYHPRLIDAICLPFALVLLSAGIPIAISWFNGRRFDA